jgi:hypothetical protein
MLKISPFRGVASNRASVVRFEKNKRMEYPMNLLLGMCTNGAGVVNYHDSYSQALSKFGCLNFKQSQ